MCNINVRCAMCDVRWAIETCYVVSCAMCKKMCNFRCAISDKLSAMFDFYAMFNLQCACCHMLCAILMRDGQCSMCNFQGAIYDKLCAIFDV